MSTAVVSQVEGASSSGVRREGTMETSKFLGKVIGPFLMVSGLWLVVYPSRLDALVQEFIESAALVGYAGRLTLLLGLLMVVGHNRWKADWTVLITVTGWLMVLSALITLFWPAAVAAMGVITTSTLGMVAYGILYIGVGGFLGYRAHRA